MSQILIWDGLGSPPKCEESCLIIFWSGRQNINQLNILSIIDFIESANNRYKNIYIDWVNRLHDNKIFETDVTPSKIIKSGFKGAQTNRILRGDSLE